VKPLRNQRRRTLAGLVILVVLALAQTGWSQVGVSTFVLDLNVSPGQTAIDSFFIVNNGTTAQDVVIEAVDWVPIGPSLQEYLAPGTLDRSLTEWLNFWPAEGIIQPGESLQVQVELLPPTVTEGAYWGMLFVRLLGEHASTGTAEAGAQVGMNVILGVAIYADTGGGEPQGRIVDFSCEPLDSGKQMMFTLAFEDTGITRLSPTGTIQIRDEEGNIVKELTLPKFTSLPDTTQRLQVALTFVPSERPGEENPEPVEPEPPLPPGTYLAIAIIDYGGDALVAAQLPFEIQQESTD